MIEHQITDAEYAAALTAGRAETAAELRAQAVRYIPERDAIEIVTNRNGGFLIPRTWIDRCYAGLVVHRGFLAVESLFGKANNYRHDNGNHGAWQFPCRCAFGDG